MLYALLALVVLGGGGLFWYEKFGPGAPPAAPAPPRQITLDSGLAPADQQTIIAAVMGNSTQTLTQLTAKYIGYPWAVYEMNYRIWELNGSQGAAPAQPTVAGNTTPTTPAVPATPATPAVPATPAAPNLPLNVTGPTTPTAPSSPAPPSGPFDLSAASIEGAWQTNSAFITAYQGALTYLAWKFNQPTWAPAAVNGTYDASTTSAVMAFQTAQGLSPIDGKVGTGTATAIAQQLTASVTQTSGQGSYAAFPAEGTGPGDSRYGAKGHPYSAVLPVLQAMMPAATPKQVQIAAGLGEDSVQGLGEDEVQGMHRKDITGAGPDRSGAAEGVMGLGEDEVQGVRRRQTTAGLGEDSVQGLGEDEVQGLGEDEVQGLGEDEVQGLGEDEVGLLRRMGPAQRQAYLAGRKAKANLGGVHGVPRQEKELAGAIPGRKGKGKGGKAGMTTPAAVVQAAQAVHAVTAVGQVAHSRPMSGWYIKMRPTDRIWPRKIVEIGSGVPRGTQGAMQHLVDLNPHLAMGGVIHQIPPGAEVNIAGSWATNLRQRGFDVRSDQHVEGVMGLGGD